MNTLSRDVATFIGDCENETITRFYDYVGIGNMYRAAVSVQGLKHVIATFSKRGYKITRIPLGTGKNGTLRYQMILLHEGREIAKQDIEISAMINNIVVCGTEEATE